jgi:hypothetical protein
MPRLRCAPPRRGEVEAPALRDGCRAPSDSLRDIRFAIGDSI